MKKIWLIITTLIITALLVNVISADTTTYYEMPINTCMNLYTSSNNQNFSYWVDGNSRGVILNGNFYLVSETNIYYKRNLYYTGACNVSNSTSYHLTQRSVNNISFYSNSWTYNNTNILLEDIPIINDSEHTSFEGAYYYTYGDGSEEPINYGTIPIEYSQNLFTEHPENNLDLIRWYGTQDNNGNDLSEVNLEIQAIAGYFQGSSYADLKTSTFSDWQASTHPAVQMFYGNYVDYHSQEYRWGDVATEFRSINTLGTWFWNIFASENTWYQYGWRYRYRLCDENDEPLTEWEFIYTGNSYSPDATKILTDPEEPLTPDTIETINDINNENNTVNNWYINNTVINNNEYNQTYQQNIIQNIYNVLTGTPDPEKHHKANDVQQTIDNAINTEDDYLNDLSSQLTDLELPDISEQTGLIKALRWVREVHKETIEETLLAPIILVILTIGLITYLIGRRNG